MVICNNNYICEEDYISFDTIETPDDCVSIGPNKCVKCETILQTQSSNPVQFNKEPIKQIFGENSTPEEKDKFWDLIQEKCNIQRPSTHGQKEEELYILEPNYEQLTDSKETINSRLINLYKGTNTQDMNAYKFLETIYKIANSVNKFKELSQHGDNAGYQRYLRFILQEDNCSSQLIHNANELPINIDLFMSKLANSSDDKFTEIIDFLNSRPQLCLEGVIELCIKILEKSGGGKRIKMTRKYKKKNKSSRKYKKKNKSTRKYKQQNKFTRKYKKK